MKIFALNPSKAQEMGKAGRERVISLFGRDAFADKLDNYVKITKAKNRTSLATTKALLLTVVPLFFLVGMVLCFLWLLGL